MHYNCKLSAAYPDLSWVSSLSMQVTFCCTLLFTWLGIFFHGVWFQTLVFSCRYLPRWLQLIKWRRSLYPARRTIMYWINVGCTAQLFRPCLLLGSPFGLYRSRAHAANGWHKFLCSTPVLSKNVMTVMVTRPASTGWKSLHIIIHSAPTGLVYHAGFYASRLCGQQRTDVYRDI